MQVYHRRDSQGNHRHAQSAPGKLCPAVRHAAAGRDAAVAHLNRFSQPGKLCTGEGIHSHHCRRLDLFADRLNQFRRLHAGLPQHAAGEDTNRAQLRQIGKFLFGQRRPEMACRQNLRRHPWTQCVRRNGTVPQPGEKDTALFRQKMPQLLRLIVGAAPGYGGCL